MKYFRLLTAVAALALTSGCSSLGGYYEQIYNGLAFHNRMNTLPQQRPPEDTLTYAQYREERDKILYGSNP